MVICPVTYLSLWELVKFQISPGGKDGWQGGMSPDQSDQRAMWPGVAPSSPAQLQLEPQRIRSQPVTSSQYKWAQIHNTNGHRLSHMHMLLSMRKNKLF